MKRLYNKRSKGKTHRLSAPYKPPQLIEGERFNRVRLIKTEFVDRPPIDLGRGVVEFYTDAQYTFECECGKRFKQWAHEFRGKRKLLDCGKCNSARFDGFTVGCVVDLPERLWKRVRVYGVDEGLTFSQALVRLCELSGWDWREWKARKEVEDSQLPEECWKWGVRVKEPKMKKCCTVPKKFWEQVERARVLYGVSFNRIVVGLVGRTIDGEKGKSNGAEDNQQNSQGEIRQ